MLCHMALATSFFSPLGLKRPIEISGPAGCSIAQLQNHCQERIASFTYNKKYVIGLERLWSYAEEELGRRIKGATEWTGSHRGEQWKVV